MEGNAWGECLEARDLVTLEFASVQFHNQAICNCNVRECTRLRNDRLPANAFAAAVAAKSDQIALLLAVERLDGRPVAV